MAEINYKPPGPVSRDFLLDSAFVCGIRGPIGSGKSTAAIFKLIINAQKQTRGRDGWRRRRTAIIRNTYPELRSTTIKTWHQWIPSNEGLWREAGPPTHRLTDETNKTDWEIMFVALDSPDDVRKLLSMELSDAWINEAREVPKAVLDGLTGRVGRFPPRDGEYGCTDPQIIMDTNPPDTDHWWFKLAEKDMSDERSRRMHEEINDIEQQLRSTGGLRPNQDLFKFFAQPGGEDANAENIDNLPPGYYLKAKGGKDAEWIKVYVNGDYGFVMDGKPVYPEYRDGVHCKPFDISPRLPLFIGIDFGLTPAAVIGQQMPSGQWRIASEVVTEDMGIIRFGEVLKSHIAQQYAGFSIGGIAGDPAGNIRGGDERTPFDLLRVSGIEARPAPGNNDWMLRRESFAKPLRTMIDGEPGMLIHPRCSNLRKGIAGGYCYRRILVSGEPRYREVPDKNMHSHVCEAGQYLMLGAGEGRNIVRREPQINRPAFALADYAILGD